MRESPCNNNNYCSSALQPGAQLSAFHSSFHTIVLIVQPRNKGTKGVDNFLKAPRSSKWLIWIEPGNVILEKPAGEGLTPDQAGAAVEEHQFGWWAPSVLAWGDEGGQPPTPRISRKASARNPRISLHAREKSCPEQMDCGLVAPLYYPHCFPLALRQIIRGFL